MSNNSYINIRNKNYIDKTRLLVDELPNFCAEFFRGIHSTTSPLTRYSYATDLRIFFNFLTENISIYNQKSLKTFTLSDLNMLCGEHIEKYLEYLTSYHANEDKNGQLKQVHRENSNTTKARKLSSLRALTKYFFKKEKLENNIPALIDMPKMREKVIIRLEKDEIISLIEASETGKDLTKNQQYFHKYTVKRDLAIIMLFLGTGIRISELVGLNINDIDFNSDAFSITRKGGDQVILYFGNDVSEVLKDYIEERKEKKPINEYDEDALFLSIQNRRITTRAVQNLIKKYSSVAVPLKKISPHKLRSTFGTMLYRETGDIYLVADVLGHKDVNTTKTHYAAQSEDNRRLAGKIIRLKDDDKTKHQ